MKQLEELKAYIYQIIVDNNLMSAALESIKQRGDVVPVIDLTCKGGSSYWAPPANKIYLDLSDVIDFYNNAKEYNNYEFKIMLNRDYYNREVIQERCKDININMPMTISECEIVENLIEKSDFLKNESMEICNVLAIYSLAYSLYHEFGHALHNIYIPESEAIKRETIADTFAFETLKSLSIIENSDVLLLGAIIGVTHVFSKLNYSQEKSDSNHPYTIERLYRLLTFWNINNNSPFWTISCNIVKKWCVNNSLSMEWDKDSFSSYKEKFIKAYLLFRRNTQ